MRKIVPFLLTVALTVVCTAGIVRASSSPDLVRGAPVAPSRVLGVDLSLGPCNSHPDNAAEWTKFANCVTNSFSKIQKWAKTLDKCLLMQAVQSRSDAIFGNDPSDPLHTGWSNGDALSWGTGGGTKYLLEWNTDAPASCPTS